MQRQRPDPGRNGRKNGPASVEDTIMEMTWLEMFRLLGLDLLALMLLGLVAGDVVEYVRDHLPPGSAPRH